VEHYSKPYVWSLQARRDLTELRDRCAFLERKGLEVSCANAIWRWENHRNAYGREKQTELDRVLAGRGITFTKAVIDNNWSTEVSFFRPGAPDWRELQDGPEFADLYNHYDHEHGYEVSLQSYHYGGSEETDAANAMSLIPACFSCLQANGLLEKVKSQNFNLIQEDEAQEVDEMGAEPDDEDEMEAD